MFNGLNIEKNAGEKAGDQIVKPTKNKKRINPRYFLNEHYGADLMKDRENVHGPGYSPGNIPSKIEWSDRQAYKSSGPREDVSGNQLEMLANMLGGEYNVLDPNSPADVRQSLEGNSKDLLPLGNAGRDLWVKTGDGQYGVIKGYEEPPDWREEPDTDPWQASDYKEPYSE